MTTATSVPADTTEQSSTLSRIGQPGSESPWVASVATVIAVLVVARFGLRPVSDPDAWWHLKTGEYLLNGGPFVGKDPWSPFSTKPFVLTQWLPEVVAAQVHMLFGWPGVAWLRCAAVLGVLAAVFWSTRRVASTLPAILAALGAVIGASGSLSERPQVVSFIFLAVTVGAWSRTAVDLRPRRWLIPMTWLWACSHGLWSIGLTVGCAFIVGLALDRRLSRSVFLKLSGVIAGSLVAACLTPVGPRLLLTPFEVATAAGPLVNEWQPSSARDFTTGTVLVMLALVVVVALRSGVRRPWWQITLTAMAFGYTLLMNRTVAVGAVLVAPLLAEALQQLQRSSPCPLTRRGRWGIASVFVGVLALAIPLAPILAGTPDGVPGKLSASLKALPAGSVILDDQPQSGWLLYTQPHLRPVIDLRSELYDPNYLRRFNDAMAVKPGWEQFVRKSGASAALVPEGAPIIEALTERLGWVITAKGDGYLVMRPGAPSEQ
jgi:hypothetical protein